jgi:peptide/nickel transport system ATP-binding protein
MNALVDISNLVVAVDATGEQLVKGVSLQVPRGGAVGILGASGSGKTLTCKALLGILPANVGIAGGAVSFDGTEITDFGPKRYRDLWALRIGAVFQDPASFLNPSVRVGRQVAEVLRVRLGRTRAEALAEAVALLGRVGLRNPERVARQYVHELSGGMLQRVMIAIAISCGPDLLVADEATTALDVTVQADVLDLLRDLRSERELTLLMVSHDLAVLASMCDHLHVFCDGRIVEHGPTEQVLRNPRHEYTRILIDNHERYGLDTRVRVAEASA